MGRSWSAVVVTTLALASGCGGGVGLTVDLRTDLAPGLEFVAVTVDVVEVGSHAEAIALHGQDYLGGHRVAELSGLMPGLYTVHARLLDAAGTLVDERTVRVDLRASYALTVVVTRDCRAVSCPRTGDSPTLTTCFGGRCVAPDCSPAMPDACGTGECIVDRDCPAASACTTAQCSLGVCLYQGDATRCAPSEWCSVDRGCTPLPGGFDGGPTSDGGTLDANAEPDAAGDAGDGDSGDTDAGLDADTDADTDAGAMCVPACGGRACGPDPVCGMSCGACGASESCSGAGTCTCAPSCGGAICGADPMCGTSCGTCSTGASCTNGVACNGRGTSSMCVPGTAVQCGGLDTTESWTGSVCCVSGVGACVAGTAVQCGGMDSVEHWTGAECCLAAAGFCDLGTAVLCGGADLSEHWSGTACCVAGATACAPGTGVQCGGADTTEHWTGSACCVTASAVVCDAGTAVSCGGADTAEHWSGTLCCVSGVTTCAAGTAVSCGLPLHWTGTRCCS